MTDTQTRRPAPTEPVPDRRLLRSRRRFARRHWRRRWLAWRHVVLAIVLVGLVTFGAWAVFLSSWLAVTGVDVSGTQTLSKARIRAIAAVPAGGPLATVDLGAIRARVGSLAEVDSVDVTRHWPHDVSIVVTERVPVAYVDLGGSLRAMDDEGVVFSTYRKAPPDLPRVEPADALDTATGNRTDSLREAAQVLAALPEALVRQVDHVEVAGVDDVELLLRDRTRVVWGSAVQSDDKARVLATLLGKGRTIDVTVPSRPTTA